jgi:hypothetical protein
MCRMNERAEFLQNFRTVFIRMVDRLESMTEAEVLDGLLQVKAARNMYKEEFFEQVKAIQIEPRVRRNALDEFAYLSSIQVFVSSVNKLRSRAAERTRLVDQRVYTVSARSVFDSLEVALNERLDALRRGPSSDS